MLDNINYMQPKILICIGKDSKALKDYLTLSNFPIVSVDKMELENIVNKQDYDLCIFGDFGDFSGLHFVKMVREISPKIPVIFISVNPLGAINAFNAGVDDYIIEPFNYEELICRIKALLRRCDIRIKGFSDEYSIGAYTFNIKEQTLFLGDEAFPLTNIEAQILTMLCMYNGDTVPANTLLTRIWRDNNYYNKRSLDAHMCILRKQLSADDRVVIKTIPRVGYRLIIKRE